MSDTGYLALTRDIDATQIPSGAVVALPAGTGVLVTQALGGSYTVHVASQAGLFRIAAKDADALGMEVVEAKADEGPFEAEKVWTQLRQCYDPEIPVNIVDLGLVYDCVITQREGEGAKVEVKMTLTAPGCGMGPTIAAEARSKVLGVPGVGEADVQLVWDPPWNQAMISEAGKMKLGLI